MTGDRDDHDDRSRRLPTAVFRPLHPSAGASARGVPRFLRPAPAAARGATAAPTRERPLFSRFAAVVEAAHEPGRASPALAPLAAPMPEPVAAPPPAESLRVTPRRAASMRPVTLAGSAVAAAVLLVALLDWRASDRRAPSGEAASAAVAAPLHPVRQRPPPADTEADDGLRVGRLLSAYRPPAVPLASDATLAAAAGPTPPPAAAPPAPEPARLEPPPLVNGSKLASAASVAPGGVAASDSDDPLYELAYRLQRKGEIASAIAAYARAAESNPDHAATFYNWGYLLEQQGDPDGARTKYLETLRLAPQHAFAHYNLACLLAKAGDPQGAIEHYRAAIAAKPDFAWSYYDLGWLEQQLGEYQEALANYHRAIETDPQQPLAYENIATILRYHHP